MAKAFGAKVIATAGSAEKAEACLKLGADMRSTTRRGLRRGRQEATDGGVDVILDMVGGDYVAAQPRMPGRRRAARHHRHRAAKSEVNVNLIMLKRLTVTGSTLRARSVA